MRKHLANLLTGIRVLGSVWMLCVPVFSLSFYGVYLLCGLTDMVDGTVARKTNSVTKFGEQLDAAADLVFAAAAFVKLVPAVVLPRWLWGWIAVLAVIRSATIVRNLVCEKRFGLDHTVMNKTAGVLLFLLPLSMPFIELRYSAAAVCAVATAAALREGFGRRTT